MKDKIKKIINILCKKGGFKKIIYYIWVYLKYKYFRLKYNSLIVRKNTTDCIVFREIFVNNELNISLNNPKFIVDCGAYVGYSTFYLAKKYPNSTIVALEPETSNFSILTKNTKKLKNVITLNKAIHHKELKMGIIDINEGKWAFQVKEENGGKIDSITIENLLKNYKFNRIDFLKIDIEGSEKELFENSSNWINKINCIAIELHDRFKVGCSDSFFNAVNKHQFEINQSGEKIIAINKTICLNYQ